ncbi:glycerophosphodiester phosphodiesterase [Verminephrobacter aporrectodeae subsp. tuberculatae]|uniref:glycerophosphodiester phosphodiesterase n=1 Tax=Verminephrobacter aporrectodeae TaxID=1110389 RepID=UPI0002375E03|nr:glycerophosphodiester phosphodiesterase [Verminephrobacter aporrectodeae]MCW8165217.1 glycerophosphodiester phosphodiesterase [Verminephrobacter aporrectodeae subsp. tuberculatae]MCW8167850.1 glycerophosphodiester phosphodiesterase [Verminephrobacter aporrectodeae subsp. tuberculatae]
MHLFRFGSLRLLSLAGLLALGACGGGTDGAASAGHLFHQPRAFDLQAHRGGVGLVVESTIASFTSALEIGVTTLELDTQITKDGVAVVTHDRKTSGTKCKDTRPANTDDPLYPYVGRYIKDLTLAQVKTLDCGSLRQAAFPEQRLVPGAQMPTLREVFELVRSYRADQVLMNIETKVEAGAPQETAPRELFVRTVVDEIRSSGLMSQVTIQSFDWGALMLARQLEPSIPIVALTNGQQFLQAGQPGASPWLGGIDIDNFGGDLVQAAKSFGADAISPVHGDPQNGKVGDAGYVPYTTPELVTRTHAAGMKIIPWTVDDEKTMHALMDAKVDGIITDRPDLLRKVMTARGLPLPPVAAKR